MLILALTHPHASSECAFSHFSAVRAECRFSSDYEWRLKRNHQRRWWKSEISLLCQTRSNVLLLLLFMIGTTSQWIFRTTWIGISISNTHIDDTVLSSCPTLYKFIASFFTSSFVGVAFDTFWLLHCFCSTTGADLMSLSSLSDLMASLPTIILAMMMHLVLVAAAVMSKLFWHLCTWCIECSFCRSQSAS